MRWTEPIEWSQGWRDQSFAVPGGGALGTGSTDFFCGAVAAGSEALRQLLDEPAIFLAALAGLVALALFGISRATWRPTAPLRVGRRRAWGQILAAAGRMYVSRPGLFGGVGLLFLPISIVITLLQATLLQASSVVGIETEGESQGFLVLLVVALGTTLTIFGLALVQAATACALVRIDAGGSIGPVEAYRRALSRIRPLLGATAIAVAVWMALSITAILIPVAIWLAIRWALFAPVVALEGQSAIGALRRSRGLVQGRWLRVPFVALTTSYVYFDARARVELEPADEPDELPAEIELT